mgnify:FL=1
MPVPSGDERTAGDRSGVGRGDHGDHGDPVDITVGGRPVDGHSVGGRPVDDGEGALDEQRRRELATEQAAIDRAYAVLDALRDAGDRPDAESTADDVTAGGTHQERFERERVTADARRRGAELRWGDPPLVFGRLDRLDDETYYVGRIGVFDEAHDPLVVDWRAPVAEPFYRATRAEPLGVRRRRSFHCRGRHLLDIDDVVLDGDGDDGSPLLGEAALLRSLAGPRRGRMTDHVATVQSEQDEIIRAPMAVPPMVAEVLRGLPIDSPAALKLLEPFTIGANAAPDVMETFRRALQEVPHATLADRLAEVLRADGRAALESLKLPHACVVATGDRLVPTARARELCHRACHVERMEGPHFLMQTRPADAARAVAACVAEIVARSPAEG